MDIFANSAGIADMCIRYGNKLLQTCKSFNHADTEIREAILRLESLWLKIQRQLEFLTKIWRNLDESYQIHQHTVLQVLQGKAQAATSLIEGLFADPKLVSGSSTWHTVQQTSDVRYAKYALMIKDNLESILKELKEWSEIFDISWYLIISLSGKEIDQQLQPVAVEEPEPLSTLKKFRRTISLSLRDDAEQGKMTVFLPMNFFSGSHESIENTGAEIWLQQEPEDDFRYVVDKESSISTLADLCKLAKILRLVDPFVFNVLKCEGLVRASPGAYHLASNRFAFSIPKSLKQPQCLRNFILSAPHHYPLNERFRLSNQLAKAIMFVHSAGFVHKNIRPETVLLFQTNESKEDSLFAFLIGFESLRLADGNTIYQGDNLWERNIYRHPTRQGGQPGMNYVMQHDIYSLGVCLLEIGLGESLVLPQPAGKESKPNVSLLADIDFTRKDRRKTAFEIKRTLVKLAQERLPSKMGRRFNEIVVTCLTCLDKTDNLFGDEKEFLDENGVLVGVRFIEKILTKLLELKV
ncbi:hypothetical protein ACMFMG_008762 [Clarireedia jacksonii]